MFDGPCGRTLRCSVAVWLGGAAASVAAQIQAVFGPFGCRVGSSAASQLLGRSAAQVGMMLRYRGAGSVRDGLSRFGELVQLSGGGDVGICFGGSELHRIVHLIVICCSGRALRSSDGAGDSHCFGGWEAVSGAGFGWHWVRVSTKRQEGNGRGDAVRLSARETLRRV